MLADLFTGYMVFCGLMVLMFAIRYVNNKPTAKNNYTVIPLFE